MKALYDKHGRAVWVFGLGQTNPPADVDEWVPEWAQPEYDRSVHAKERERILMAPPAYWNYRRVGELRLRERRAQLELEWAKLDLDAEKREA